MEAEPQEARAMAARYTSRNRKRRRSAEAIVRIVSEREAGRDNWTVGQNWGRGLENVDSLQLIAHSKDRRTPGVKALPQRATETAETKWKLRGRKDG